MKAPIQAPFLMAAVTVALLASTVAAAQLPATLSGPVVGYVFDSQAQKLRPLRGILGSATIGMPVEPGFPLSEVLMLDANHFIVLANANPELLTLNMEVHPPSITAISGALANPSRAAGSFQKKTAALYYADAQQVLIVTGLPEKPALSRRVDLSLLNKPVTHMAVSDDGTLLVFVLGEGDGEGEGQALYAWTASSDRTRFLTAAVSVSALAMTRNDAAIVADRGADEVFAIWDPAGPAVRQFLAGAREGVSSPAGVAVGNNNRIYVGNAGSATVTVLDFNGRYLGTHHCSCELTGVYPLLDSAFRLTDRTNRTIFLLDASSTEERILFVPPAKD